MTGLHRTLLILSTIDWDETWQRHHVFAEQFAKQGWNVFFLENTGFRNPRIKDVRRVLRKVISLIGLRGKRVKRVRNPVPDRVEVITPFLLPPNGWLFRTLNRIFFLPRLIQGLKHKGLVNPDLILVYLPSWTTIQLLARLRGKKRVFDLVANFWDHPDRPKDMESMMKEIFHQMDAVLTDSDYLLEKAKRYHHNLLQVHQGVRGDAITWHSSRFSFPSSYRTICYFGTIDSRIDWEVLHALKINGAEIILIGPTQLQISTEFQVLGPYDHDEIHHEISKYDVLILPYLTNSFNQGIVPAKLFECLATGKPILATPLPSLSKYRDIIYLCRTTEEFVNAFHHLPSTENSEKRRKRIELAKENTHDANFSKVLQFLEL